MNLAFQSTRPVKGATVVLGKIVFDRLKFQSTRPVKGATVETLVKTLVNRRFNPRAP